MFFLTTGDGGASILYQVFIGVLSFFTGSSIVLVVILLCIIHQLCKRPVKDQKKMTEM